jgi:hypothetical protein
MLTGEGHCYLYCFGAWVRYSLLQSYSERPCPNITERFARCHVEYYGKPIKKVMSDFEEKQMLLVYESGASERISRDEFTAMHTALLTKHLRRYPHEKEKV